MNIKYMNKSFFEDQVYDWGNFKRLVRTPVPKLHPPPPPRGDTIRMSNSLDPDQSNNTIYNY